MWAKQNSHMLPYGYDHPGKLLAESNKTAATQPRDPEAPLRGLHPPEMHIRAHRNHVEGAPSSTILNTPQLECPLTEQNESILWCVYTEEYPEGKG